MKRKEQLPLDTEIEVIAKKKMTYGNALKIQEQFEKKGWKFGLWQVGFNKSIIKKL